MIQTEIDRTDIPIWNNQLSRKGAEEILAFSLRKFGDTLCIACSFSKEDVAILSLLSDCLDDKETCEAFILDTGRLHEETYEVWQSCRERFPKIRFVAHAPKADALEELLLAKGPFSFYNSVDERKECCRIRKVEPLARALAGRAAWITGMRREQSVTRSELEPFSWDSGNGGLVKVSPLFDWDGQRLDRFTKDRSLPVHPLHTKGYPSIGCAPCTRAVSDGEDFRAGRWWWENPESKECGLHTG